MAKWIVCYPPSQNQEDLDLEKNRKNQQIEDGLLAACNEIKTVATMAQQFIQLFTDKSGEAFDQWLKKALEFSIALVKNFAKSLQEDYEAVKNAVTLEWSNGQAEGQVNRIKLIKRQMYGRAGFEFLKKRVLYNDT